MKANLILSAVFLLLFQGCAHLNQPENPALGSCAQLAKVEKFILTNHVSVHQITPEVQERIVSKMADLLDPMRITLVYDDFSVIRDAVTKLHAARPMDCDALMAIKNLMEVRVQESADFVHIYLQGAHPQLGAKKVDFTKSGFGKTLFEKQESLKGYLRFLAYTLKETAGGKDLAVEIRKLYAFAAEGAKRLSGVDMNLIYMQAFAQAIDPHSFIWSESTQKSTAAAGVGIEVGLKEGFLEVRRVIPGGSAERSGKLKSGDLIYGVAADGKPLVLLKNMSLSEFVGMIRGKEGTQVRLLIRRKAEKGRSEDLDVTLERAPFDMAKLRASLDPKIDYEFRERGGRKVRIGVISLSSFDQGISKKVKKLLEQAEREKVDGVVLNLAGSLGGLLEECFSLSGLFVGHQPILQEKSSLSVEKTAFPKDDAIAYAGPLVVLVDEATASGAEIVAGALQDLSRALIVGAKRTFGNGTVQTVIQLSPGMFLKLTVSRYFLPSGRSIQFNGISSDVVIPARTGEKSASERDYENALQPETVPAFAPDSAKRMVPSEAQLSSIKKMSAARMKMNPKGDTLGETIEILADWVNAKKD